MYLLQQLILSLLFLLLLSSDRILLLISAKSITLSLSRMPPPTTIPHEILKYHADASLARAHHLINGYGEYHLPLYPRGYGEYTVNLSFGTPPQNLSFIMDTGSDLVWFPCTHHYNCTRCDAPPAHIPTFIPQSSSSFKTVACQSPQCKWLFRDQDRHCSKNYTKCVYTIGYGEGNTIGLLVSETLTFPGGLSKHDFAVGCSVSSDDAPPDGIVGFGRTQVSLPSQLGLTSFSYCMVSHDFDDNTTATSDLVLSTTTTRGKSNKAKFFTPFVSNPAEFPYFYYVSLQSISVGRVQVKVPVSYQLPDAKGIGGTVVDSGTTYTLLEQSMYDAVVKQLEKQVGKRYGRDKKAENETGLEPCYNVDVEKNNKLIKLPQFTFRFQGNTEMVMPLANIFSYANKNKTVVCMTIMKYGEKWGPAIFLGNYLQQDYHMEYDLECNRLGIRQQKCK